MWTVRHESRANEAAGSSLHHVENAARPEKVSSLFFPADMRLLRPPVTSVTLCDQPVRHVLPMRRLESDRSRLVMRKDGVLNQLPPWDSLCSQQ